MGDQFTIREQIETEGKILEQIRVVNTNLKLLSVNTEMLADRVAVQNGRIAALEKTKQQVAELHARTEGERIGRAQTSRRDMAIMGALIALIPTAASVVVALVS